MDGGAQLDCLGDPGPVVAETGPQARPSISAAADQAMLSGTDSSLTLAMSSDWLDTPSFA